MCHWGRHHIVMAATGGWQSTKIGAGPTPIETTEGWLLIYHDLLTSCNGFVYSAGAALLDLDRPWKVMYRTVPYIISPQKSYELIEDTPNVVFPCAALCDATTGRIAIYYGAADTVTCMAFAQVDELIEFVKRFMGGMAVNDETLALDVIDEAGPHGHYLDHKHTLKHFRDLWQPTLFTRQRADDWVAEGSKRLGERLRERTIAIIEEHQPEPLPDSVREEIAYILRTIGRKSG